MSASSSDDAGDALPPMALLAALQTAWTVKGGIRARRDGRDPAAQEPAPAARAYLESAAREMTRLHMQLLMAKVQAARRPAGQDPGEAGEPDDAASESLPGATPSARRVATVRRFDMLMKLRRVERLLHGAHQRLMSLYPAVSEELVEEARRCQSALAAWHTAGGGSQEDHRFGEPLALFLQRLLSFAAWLEREV